MALDDNIIETAQIKKLIIHVYSLLFLSMSRQMSGAGGGSDAISVALTRSTSSAACLRNQGSSNCLVRMQFLHTRQGKNCIGIIVSIKMSYTSNYLGLVIAQTEGRKKPSTP